MHAVNAVDEGLQQREAVIRRLSRVVVVVVEPAIHVGPEDADRLVHGQRVHGHEGIPSGLVAVAAEGRLLAIADEGEGILRPRKVFAG
jgi:hypothetical protein